MRFILKLMLFRLKIYYIKIISKRESNFDIQSLQKRIRKVKVIFLRLLYNQTNIIGLLEMLISFKILDTNS